MTHSRRTLAPARHETRFDLRAGTEQPSLRFPKPFAALAQPIRIAGRGRSAAARLV